MQSTIRDECEAIGRVLAQQPEAVRDAFYVTMEQALVSAKDISERRLIGRWLLWVRDAMRKAQREAQKYCS